MHNGVDAVDRQCVVGQVGERVNAQCQQVGQARADDAERQPEYQRHNADKAGQGGVFAGQDAVNGHTALVLAAFTGPHNGFVAETFNKVEPHIRQRCLAVQTRLTFQLGNRVTEQLGLVRIEVQRGFDQRIALDQLCCGKTQRQPGAGSVILDQMAYGVYTAVHRTARAVPGVAEVNAARRLAVAGHMQCVLDQLVDALILGGGNWHNRHAEQLLQLVDHDGAAVGADLIHHVQRQNQRNVQLHELHR